MRWQITVLATLLAFAELANAGSAKIIKVLPHFLDEKGRHTLSPSLYDRDAYQALLRYAPEKRSGLRFDVQWKARGEPLTLRIEGKGMRSRQPSTVLLERQVHPGLFSRWSSVSLTGNDYQGFGELTAWRATLWQGTNQVAEQKSFLW